MTGRLNTLALLVCTAASIACGRDHGMEPEPGNPPDSSSVPAPVLADIALRPRVLVLDPSDTVQLAVVYGSQSGSSETFTFSSHAPAVASVSSTGLVTGVGLGSTRISVEVSSGLVTREAWMMTYVTAPAQNQLVVTAERAWEPDAAQLLAGGTVQWVAGATNWSGVPHTTLWLMNEDFSDLDSLDLSSGSASRKFETPGTFHYCSGSCWDPPDWGVIRVR